MIIKKTLIIYLLVIIILIPLSLSAKVPILDPEEGGVIEDLKSTAGEQGMGYETYGDTDLIKVRMALTIKILRYLLGLLGIFFLILIIIGGYEWMSAGGNEEKVANAKKRIRMAINGMIIILGAYVISSFILSELYDITVYSRP